ncbi:MAG: hypothetical protein F6K44_23135, partial [Moorea sp. SIO3E2]|nr:hypothetical protein [Moorena sp. SIO3E2]
KTTDYQGEHREGRQDRRVTPISLMRPREDDRGWKDGGMEGLIYSNLCGGWSKWGLV